MFLGKIPETRIYSQFPKHSTRYNKSNIKKEEYMKIIAHRGYWRTPAEKNQRQAFYNAIESGWGIETDIRDCGGRLVISHDPPQGNEILLEELLEVLSDKKLPLALNIKADGLSQSIHKLINKYNYSEYFTFDMSIPELVLYIKQGITTFTGLSDLVSEAPLQALADGIWLDCFNGDWYDASFVDKLMDKMAKVAIVSPELHNRPYESLWQNLLSCRHIGDKNLLLCTDHPEIAQKVFKEFL